MKSYLHDMSKPTIITAQQYGTKVSVELDHSDTGIDELFDAFQTLIVGLGYHESAWKGWIVERAAEYQEEENEKWDEFSTEDDVLHHEKVKQSVKDALARYTKDSEGFEDYNHTDEDYDGQFEDWDNETPEENKPNKVLIDAKKQYEDLLKMNAKKSKK